MTIESLRARTLTIPFNVSFKHASAERASTQTLWVEAHGSTGEIGHGEGCPREYVTNESLAGAQSFFAVHQPDWRKNIHDIETLAKWAMRHRAEIDANPASWAAVELALLDLFGKEAGQSIEALIGLPELAGSFCYTAVIGDAAPPQFEAQLTRYIQAGFRDFKIKLSGQLDRDLTKVAALISAGITPQKSRADANNLWRDASMAIEYLKTLNYDFFAIEEPLQPGNVTGMQHISTALNTRIILDESLLRIEQLRRFFDLPENWIVNLRISKMGGLLRSLELARTADKSNLRLIVGAHVGETSVLTRAALTVAHSSRNIVLAQEGAFGTHFLAHDVAEPPLMFGAGGILNADTQNLAGNPGWGLNIPPLR